MKDERRGLILQPDARVSLLRLLTQGLQDGSLVWMRDVGELLIRKSRGKIVLVSQAALPSSFSERPTCGAPLIVINSTSSPPSSRSRFFSRMLSIE